MLWEENDMKIEYESFRLEISYFHIIFHYHIVEAVTSFLLFVSDRRKERPSLSSSSYCGWSGRGPSGGGREKKKVMIVPSL